MLQSTDDLMRDMLPDAGGTTGGGYPRDTAADQSGGDFGIYYMSGGQEVITDDVNLRNLGSAGRISAEDLNLRLSQVNSWTYEQRAAYVDHLAQTILQYPEDFNPLTLKMAQDIYDGNIPAMDDTGFLDQGFGYAVGDELMRAGNDLASLGNGILNLIHGVGTGIGSVGQGVSNLGGVTTWLLPVAGILLVFMFTQSSAAKVNRASWLK